MPDWLKPYLAAAIRSGLTTGLLTPDGFGPDLPVTGEEAAAMLCCALSLNAQEQSVLSAEEAEAAPTALEIAAQNGFCLTADQIVTRGEAAKLLYLASSFR